jgi:hypothetical protein
MLNRPWPKQPELPEHAAPGFYSLSTVYVPRFSRRRAVVRFAEVVGFAVVALIALHFAARPIFAVGAACLDAMAGSL